MRTLYQDIRYALRQLRKSPAFTATAVLTLALGIGANTAVFTMVHEVLLKSLPVHNPGGLYRVGDKYECCIEGSLQKSWILFSYPFYQQVLEHTPEWEQLAAMQSTRPDLSVRRPGSAAAESFNGELVSGNYFSVFGVQPFAGRLISPDDDRDGAAPVAVMSYRAWEQKYGLDQSMIGGSVTINNIPMTLVGVAPPGFYGDRRESDPPDFWMPISSEPLLAKENSLRKLPMTAWLFLIGRLRPGAQPAEVSAHMTAELQQFLSVPGNIGPMEDKSNIAKQVIQVTSGAGGMNAMEEDYKSGLMLLLAAAGVILLIACANVANLLLARGAATRVRTSLQLAVGATRARVIRAGITEAVVLAILGGAAGLLMAYFASKAILAMAFRGSEFVPISASPSLPVLGFTFLVALLTGVIFGIIPAWMASRSDPAEALRGASRSGHDPSSYGQKSLVVVQAALSLVLLTSAGLLTQTLRNLHNQPFGFERQGRLLVQFSERAAGYTQERLIPLYHEIEDRFSHMPGVISESLSLYTAQQGNNWGEGVYIEGQPPSHDNGASWDRVSPHYFETIGTPIVQGRGFKESDTATSQRVAVVNEAFVKKYFKDGQNPIGQHFGKDEPSHAGDYEIVGVCKDAKYQSQSRPQRATFFIPLYQTMKYDQPVDNMVETASMYMSTLELHVQGDPMAFASQVRQTLARIDANLVPLSMRTFDDQIELQSSNESLVSRLTIAFGLLALLLASIGLYGLTTYQVTRRTGEIGIRMALGADRLNIVRLILRGAFSYVGIGLLIGIPLVFLAGKLMASQLFGVSSFAPAILIGATAVLALSALIASVLPARRAAAIDPMRALRTE